MADTSPVVRPEEAPPTATLWLQRHITSGSMSLRRQPGSDNVADVGTKHVDSATLVKHLKSMGFVHMDGRSAIALKAAL
eukprot:873851-Amphidinium_carterae.1